MEKLFESFVAQIEEENSIREKVKSYVKQLSIALSKIEAIIQQIHTKHKEAPSICQKARELFPSLKDIFSSLQEFLVAEQYHRFRNHWRNNMTKTVFLIALIHWLDQKRLIELKEVETILGLPGREKGVNAFAVELEEYLMGLAMLPSELARLCVNSVVANDYQFPGEISKFVTELNLGFRALNLKNDFLRKKFDSIKYDVSKIENVVYDISIRSLNKK
eukprot:TRINITY_DN4657_c0_g1_i1.p1 TRINITY_DN4657_c0_g1~~TRINITY_DN4657_c0_g1_i1.p1  ORF type:complete len:219 (+),score=25.94 TRINITY_DN4657_c0_g1_i1:36-692(+)